MLTDGAEWRAYQLRDGALVESTRHVLSLSKPDRTGLAYWLDGVLAVRQSLVPTPAQIAARLGAASASHALDRASLAGLYAANANLPTVEA